MTDSDHPFKFLNFGVLLYNFPLSMYFYTPQLQQII